jgi:hypothetical protein
MEILDGDCMKCCIFRGFRLWFLVDGSLMKARETTPVTSNQARQSRLIAALAQAVALNPFAEVVDPIDWQCEQRQNRSLPGRSDAD